MAGRAEEFTIRLAPEIKAEIETAAAAEQRSLAGLIRVLIADALAARRAAQRQPARTGKGA
jgi:hypothetical protein